MRRLAAYPRQNALAKTLKDIGRLERTLFTLDWISDPALRRRTNAGLNKGEARNALARAVFFHRLGEIRDRTFENQSYRASGLNLAVAAIILWNTVYLGRAVDELRLRRRNYSRRASRPCRATRVGAHRIQRRLRLARRNAWKRLQTPTKSSRPRSSRRLSVLFREDFCNDPSYDCGKRPEKRAPKIAQTTNTNGSAGCLIGGFPWRGISDLLCAKEIRAMPAAVKLREDFSARELRALARRAKDVNQSRRLLSLAAVRDGKDRAEAAQIGGMDRQTLRDWVHRFNASGPEGLFDHWTEGPKPRLSAEQLIALASIVGAGPDREKDGVVRWRRVDLQRVIKERFGVDFHERYVGTLLKKLGFSHISARPRHPAQDARIVEAYKKASKRR